MSATEQGLQNRQPLSAADQTRLIATLRRQITCLEKRVAQMRRDAANVQAGRRVLRWARQVARQPHKGSWPHIQLQRAMKDYLERFEK